ncbi:MAG: heme o synthase [Moraxellaceae bacterium]|jgi:protoheme IX farnesyltransferase|nr:heme o synthase [Moraxellaceae bacterium]MBP7229041.1 heme o synthase [Moraxellaceae bacterium]MBP8852301.1 heme o synthase [Moraxellaceae bacterium]MBP9046330.1 heme o synthase [Moraxellaceae bacterium]MBP9730849.1 heme o synthase [Moraxellaceae bacterium]
MTMVAVEKEEAPLWRAYWELTKPGVVALLMVTAVIGMFLSTPGMVPLRVLILGSLGMALAMMASAVINQIMDQRIDAIMARTHRRPLVQGRVNTRAALIFAAVLGLLSLVILDVFINRLTAVLTFFGIIGYAFIYTMWLKRATPQNIVIGGLAGAIPPLLGWTAVTGAVHPHALLLVLIIFAWTPPHFWALAIHRRDEYAKADIPMLPVTHGIEFTKTAVLLYTVILFLIALLPYLTGMSGLIYLAGATVLGGIFLVYALRLKFRSDPSVPMKTFGFSITYLFALFLILLVDHYFSFRLV